MRGRLTWALTAAATAAVMTASAAQADTLREALLKAYQTNPTITGARAGQRANDENVPIARAEGLPDAAIQGGYTENVIIPGNSFTSPERIASGQGQITVPIYQGGAVRNAVRAADRRVIAGQASLRATESSIFSAVVAAYMDVIRDSSILALNENQVRVLETNLQATRDRFEVGDLTRTDVAQSEARLATAQSELRLAQARLTASRERYVELVGDVPDDLAAPPPLPNLPTTADAAVDLAVDENPDLAAARQEREASRYDVGVARASRLPRLSAVGNGSYQNFLGTLGSGVPGVEFSQSSRSASIGLQASLPIYQGGGPSARVRQAQAREGQAIEQEIAVERDVVEQTRASFASYQASLDAIRSNEIAVAANQLALEGTRAEQTVGTRNILDVLNAEQELLNSQVALVTARRDAYVAGFSLLAAMGQAEAADLGLDGGTLYDPVANYRRVRRIIWDWDEDPRPRPVATRTVDTPADTPVTAPPQ